MLKEINPSAAVSHSAVWGLAAHTCSSVASPPPPAPPAWAVWRDVISKIAAATAAG